MIDPHNIQAYPSVEDSLRLVTEAIARHKLAESLVHKQNLADLPKDVVRN